VGNQLAFDWQNHFGAGGGGAAIRCYPRGGLKLVTNRLSAITWFSMWPGLLGIVGYLINRFKYGRQWIFEYAPVSPDGFFDIGRVRSTAMSQEAALKAYEDLKAWLLAGHEADTYEIA
jgi:hypothetical protein